MLRRYSDFLWLFEALALNNPGVIIPPVPEKMPFGRFAEQFVESRRLALNRCIQKIANHSQLALDPDLQLFLESDSFALDVRLLILSDLPGVPDTSMHRSSIVAVTMIVEELWRP